MRKAMLAYFDSERYKAELQLELTMILFGVDTKEIYCRDCESKAQRLLDEGADIFALPPQNFDINAFIRRRMKNYAAVEAVISVNNLDFRNVPLYLLAALFSPRGLLTVINKKRPDFTTQFSLLPADNAIAALKQDDSTIPASPKARLHFGNVLHNTITIGSVRFQSVEERIEELLSCCNVDIDTLNDEGYTPLRIAAEKCTGGAVYNLSLLKRLIELGATIDNPTNAALREAALTHQYIWKALEFVDFLIGKNIVDADFKKQCIESYRTKDNGNLIHAYIDCSSDSSKLDNNDVNTLIAKTEFLNALDKNGYSPLSLAICKGSQWITFVTGFIAAGANMTIKVTNNPKYCSGSTLLHVAATYKDPRILIEILKHKQGQALVNVPDDSGVTPLLIAASLGNTKSVAILLENGADTSVTNKQGQGLTYYASLNDDTPSFTRVQGLVTIQATVEEKRRSSMRP